ncbi:MAG TPA: DUF4062 domain-containing protein [Fibrobacteria bacterium]|nr:DUF4062 domain-containing protein [Fibrobacteria bacterium]
MEKSLHIFVCSTYRDLVSERNAVLDGLEWLRTQYPTLSYFCPRSILPLEVCKEEIRRSDVLVLILGHLNGVIAPGLEISHGEAEYLEGIAQGKKVLVFLRDEKVGIFPVHFERDRDRQTQLKAFKQKLIEKHGAETFTDLQSLVTQVNHGLTEVAGTVGLEPKPGSKNAPLKVKSWETRKLPMYAGSPSVEFTPAKAGEGATRTIPILQKALTTPFRHRKASSSNLSTLVGVGVAILVGSVLLLAWFKKQPLSKAITLPSTQATEAAHSPATVDPEIAPEASDAGTPALAAPPKKEGTVVLMDDTDTIKTLILKAQDGSPEEQYTVGTLYEEGREVRKSDTAAFHWYKRAADRGYPEAEFKVALMYRWGKGTVKNSFQAARWFQAAADHGHPKAQVQLGRLYQTGKGVPRNEMTALKWFLRAADQKDPEAEKIIADLKSK